MRHTLYFLVLQHTADRRLADTRWDQWAERKAGADAGFPVLFEAFQATTNHGMLTSVKATLAGRHVYLRFKCATGEQHMYQVYIEVYSYGGSAALCLVPVE